MARTIEIDNAITVGALSEALMLPVSRVITELFKNGIMATVNERIDYETAQIIVSDLELDVELKAKEHEAPANHREARQVSDKAVARPPVVAFMGHVDHGKTSLMDAIRGAEVVKEEAGGITQHISAFQIDHNGRLLTLLDTPGHEAFAALREHGAQLTDLVVIVVAADDGIKPQTIEAIRFARRANVKMIVAANKMDKPEADINRLKQQLAENDLLIEEWGGEIILLPVSAKTKEGIPQLLDMILLVADVEELKADVDGPAQGLVIESHMETGRGPIAIAMVENGTLHQGDFIAAGGSYGKVRTLETSEGKPIKSAGPSTPVRINGLKNLPEFGDEFIALKDEKTARNQAVGAAQSRRAENQSSNMSGQELLRIINRSNELQELNIIVKADVQGSLTSVIDSLKTLANEEVAVRIVGSGIGVVNENDIHMAATSKAIIYGFHVSLPPSIRQLALRDKVSVRLYSVIYELIDDVKLELETMLSPEVIETELGSLEVKGIFKITKTEVICGGEVKSGKLSLPAMASVTRGEEKIADDLEVIGLKRGPQEAKEVVAGEMCGLSFSSKSRVEVQEGDVIKFYNREAKARSL